MKIALNLLLFTALAASFVASPKPDEPDCAVVTIAPRPTPTPADESIKVVKKNGRPAEGTRVEKKEFTPVYTYEFTRPGFTYERILVQHDEDGRGAITFKKEGYNDLITDPIELSPGTMTRLRDTLTALNFVDSNENYQYTKDYPQMGNNRFTIKRGERERTVNFNWTENKLAKDLMDLYRGIGSEYTWRFEMQTALVNQPLLTPGLMDAMDGYLQRNEIVDPHHLVPILTSLSTDERMPLMGRDRALKLIGRITKAKK